MLMKYFVVVLLGLMLPLGARAQSDSNDTPLGDIARAMRKSKAAPTKTVIDNDNFSQVLDQVESRRTSGSQRFTFDSLGKEFQVSGPDVTCSLSFNSQATSLLSDPFVTRSLPGSELAKLDGPATIADDNLQIAVFNGSGWQLREITIALTLAHKSEGSAAFYGTGKLRPASAVETIASPTKHSDQTVLYHIRGAAAPLSNAVFRAPLGLTVGAEQEWHWAIVEAKGVPPKAE